MRGRGRLLAVAAAGLMGLALPALAQALDDLKPTLDEEEDAAAAPAEVDIPRVPQLEVTPQDKPPDTRLEVNAPEEPVAKPRRRRIAVVEPFASQGLGSPVFQIYPTLGVDAVYSSNPTTSSSDPQDAFGARIRPTLRFESGWSRHSWTGEARASLLEFEGDGEKPEIDANASTRFRLDILRTTRAEFEARYTLDQTGAEDSEVPDSAAENRNDQTFGASGALIHDFGPIEGRVRAGANVQLYDDVKLVGGGTEDNSDRNYAEPTFSMRATYSEPPVFKPFVEVGYAPRFHFKSTDRNGQKRDSHGLNASVGVALDRGPIWTGEAAVVYSLRDYDDSALKTADVLGVNGNVTWRPTELTEITATASTALNETSAAGSSASRSWTFGFDAVQAIRENVDLIAGTDVTLEDTRAGTDVTVDMNLGVEWQLNPWMTWSASYDATWFNGVGNGGDYREHRVTTGIELRP